MWDLEIRLAYAVSASLAPPANPAQRPIPIKGSITHVCSLRKSGLPGLEEIFDFCLNDPQRGEEMSDYKEDDDRERLSWSEIDKLRNRSRHVGREQGSFQEGRLKSDWARKQHLHEANKFFLGKKGTAAYQKAHAALHEGYGTPAFPEAAKKFLKDFGLPDDWGTLLLLLDLPDSKWVSEALQALKGLYGKRSLLEQKGFKGKLRILATTTRDKNFRVEIESLLEAL